MNRSPTQATDSSSENETRLKQALRQAAASIKELIAENDALKHKSPNDRDCLSVSRWCRYAE
jgi:hypothetical protein